MLSNLASVITCMFFNKIGFEPGTIFSEGETAKGVQGADHIGFACIATRQTPERLLT